MESYEFTDLICMTDEVIKSVASITDAVIYRIHQKSTDKNYIGLTRNLWKRLYKHYGYITPIINNNEKKFRGIHKAIIESGPEDFELIIELKGVYEELDPLESEFIEKYNSYNNGFNKTLDGKGSEGRHLNIMPTIPKGSIAVNDGKYTKFITREEYDLIDKSIWSLGSIAKGLICMTNGDTTIRVRESDLDHYIRLGYKRGLHYSPKGTSGRKPYHLGSMTKFLYPDQFEEYESLGWEPGHSESRRKRVSKK